MLAAVRLLSLAVALLIPSPALAQQPGPPGPYIVDARLVLAGVPFDPAFFPPIPSGTLVPTRSLGIDVGGHVYPFGIGPARVGIGVSLVRSKGRTGPPEPATTSTSSPPPPQTQPDVETSLSAIVPQLSFNFGSETGWSYISAGMGQTRTRSTTSAYATGSGSSARTVPEDELDLARRQTINIGGGARWFLQTHVAFSFDVRLHLVAARTVEGTATPKATLVVAGAGFSFR